MEALAAQALEDTLAVAAVKNVISAAKSDTSLATVPKVEAHSEGEEEAMARAKVVTVVATEVDVEAKHATHVEVRKRLSNFYHAFANVPRIRTHE